MSEILTITDAAAEKFKEFLGASPHYLSKRNPVVRVSVRGGGCSGLQYSLGVEEASDEEYRKAMLINGIYVVIDTKSALYLAGATIDYINGLMQSGFKIENPNAKTTCGCGQSFA